MTTPRSSASHSSSAVPAGPLWGIGAKFAPPRFVLFLAVLLGTFGWTLWLDSANWGNALVIGFNLAAVIFVLSLWPLRRDHTAAQMRLHSAQNNAGRAMVLLVTAVVMLAILGGIAAELPAARAGDIWATAKLIFTLTLAWTFTNLVFALHYAHAHYAVGDDDGGHRAGFVFKGTQDPDYWDFLYFSFTAGMSFAASDVDVTRGAVRRIVLLQCLLSFIFNIGVIAFIINALGG